MSQQSNDNQTTDMTNVAYGGKEYGPKQTLHYTSSWILERKSSVLQVVSWLAVISSLIVTGWEVSEAATRHAALRSNQFSFGNHMNTLVHTHPSYFETLQFPDVDGDGLSDVCARLKHGIWCVHSTDVSGSFTTNPPSWRYNGMREWTYKFNDGDGWGDGPEYWQTIKFPDVNGDGKADVCGRGFTGIWCGVSSGSSFTRVSRWATHYGDDEYWHTDPGYWSTISYPDINGDGAADICGRGQEGVYCMVADPVRERFVNFDLKVSFSDQNGWNLPEYWSTIRYPNLDGDEYADICARGSRGLWCYFNNGQGTFVGRGYKGRAKGPVFGDRSGWNGDPSFFRTIQFGDINGDRHDDVCLRGREGVVCATLWEVEVPSTRGDNYFIWVWAPNITSSNDPGQAPFFSDTNDWNQEKFYGSLRLIDVDDDGKADLCGRGELGIYCARSSAPRPHNGGYSLPSFYQIELWVDNFGDQSGWGNSPSYWSTVQPANVDDSRGLEWCGRGFAGIWCSEF